MRYCKRTEAGRTLRLFNSAATLPPDWDTLIPPGHFLRSDQLRVSELSKLPDLQFFYVLISDGEKPLAAAYFQLLSLDNKHINSKLVTKQQAILWSLFTNVARPKMLVAGHLFRHDICSFYWQPELTPFEAYQCYKQAIDYTLKQSWAMAVLLKDAASELTTYFQHLSPEFIFLRNDISMELELPSGWSTMADYEKALKHKYAQRFRKIRSAWNELEVKELSVREVTEQKDKLFWLYNQVTENQQVRLGLLSADFLVQQKMFYKDELRIWGIYEVGKIIGFYSAWVKDDVFDMFYIGFDYSRNADLQLYFNILFFSIEQGLNFGKKKVILGRTALDAKARLGCSPHYLSTFLYIRNRFLRNRVLILNNKSSAKEGAWEERHPFKPVAQS
ncbi:hypothetical protein [Polluticoccus soli]|uniref:hypothetical protein n=1 Tax=Polluticoccus soli TaxID=3034150 RepID=UPI0023E22AC7|nr:hypothetical protein [Flavipsychrobacter sp. JY13-12]